MECQIKNVFKITQGSKEDLLIRLNDPSTGERFDLSPFNAGKACFPLTGGGKIEKTLTLPGSNPQLGIIEFTLDSADTAQMDENNTDFEIELTYSANPNNKEVITFLNSLEVTNRLCP